MDPDALSPSQQAAVAQLQALTNGGDVEVAIGVLASVDWDVQRAADVVFDSNPSAPLSISNNAGSSSSPPTPARMDTFDVDDSEQQGLLSGRPTGRQFRPVSQPNTALTLVMRSLRLVIAILALPYALLRVVFRFLRIPLPLPALPPAYSIGGLGLSLAGSRPGLGAPPARDPKTAAERWIQSLEEETGCVSFSRSQASSGEATGVASGSSSAVSRRPGDDSAARVLPDFFVGSYESFARACARELDAKIGCVVIVSEEHDDVAAFKRTTLTDPEFVRLMHENDFLVWGGDIRDRDAWSAAQKLQATTYPFVAFIALQARRGVNAPAAASPVLTVLSRHQGPSIPAGTAPTSARTLIKHLQDQLLPRVGPFLSRTRAQATDREAAQAVAARERVRERELRAEQDRAFEESARRDRERIEKKRAEERAAREDARRQEEEEQQRLEQARQEEAEREQWAAKRMHWRRYGRRALLTREPRPGEQGRGRTVRVAVRLPEGKRAVRFFGEADSLTAVYAFVDTLFIPEGAAFAPALDPAAPPDGAGPGEEGLLAAMEAVGRKNGDWWGFKLAMAYPRKEIHWEAGLKVGDVEGLSGGQLVVELLDDPRSASRRTRASLDSKRSNERSSGSASDEYETESD